MALHLLVRLQAPLIAFGGEAIDNYGVIRSYPALSMVTGLLGNALGWDRSDADLHNRLQARLRLGTRLDNTGQRLNDFQTAQLDAGDKGWTTAGSVEERRGGSSSYDSPHLRYRDYHANLDALLALRLEPADESPILEDLAQALDKPIRPLFIGRKPCLPIGRLVAGWIEASNVLEALQLAPGQTKGPMRLQWPEGEGRLEGCDRLLDVCDERNWSSGVHGGWRPVREALISSEEARP
ncbi:type I-E CRISPR-associated protein Cas5/CasD [Cupriavidus sp. AcVe19-1a]|uniref:type I-E CRISPR-associated protein Cas5/CasD n=1 Tax=Cupriavidus sp. AcVe19-1a TaxID=2821359 RepID=UPI001AE958AB|nr:type I-E CRISPR-associated protein Cas5/CasD [Cupriavidus sp. AcVe19-1a]MBP0633507.1 type I-E CRISPR-associated protein Cas5/CasD [Cupriavidus sp. AcVe19-1a]